MNKKSAVVYQVAQYPGAIFSTATKAKRWARSSCKSKLLTAEVQIIAKRLDGLAIGYCVAWLSTGPKREWVNNPGFNEGKV